MHESKCGKYSFNDFNLYRREYWKDRNTVKRRFTLTNSHGWTFIPYIWIHFNDVNEFWLKADSEKAAERIMLVLIFDFTIINWMTGIAVYSFIHCFRHCGINCGCTSFGVVGQSRPCTHTHTHKIFDEKIKWTMYMWYWNEEIIFINVQEGCSLAWIMGKMAEVYPHEPKMHLN